MCWWFYQSESGYSSCVWPWSCDIIYMYINMYIYILLGWYIYINLTRTLVLSAHLYDLRWNVSTYLRIDVPNVSNVYPVNYIETCMNNVEYFSLVYELKFQTWYQFMSIYQCCYNLETISTVLKLRQFWLSIIKHVVYLFLVS